jgi:hypothetical protein
MKKVLSLVLVIALAFSLVTFASAANPTTKFSDGKDVKNVTAVDLLTGIGVIEGSNGKFDPTGTLTRQQAAKIIAYLLNGSAAANLKATSAPFSDVAASRWSAGYIAFCVEEGILSGVGDGNFDPEGKLTGFAWNKMLLCALGYDATAEGFTGSNWTINVAKVVNKVGLTLGLSLDLSANISRDDACQLAYNTLTADMVEYPNSGTTIIVGGTTVQTGAGAAQKVSKASGGYLSAGNDMIMQLCEMYYGYLQKTTMTKFGRNGYTWTNSATSAPISAFYSTDKVLATSYSGKSVTDLTDPTNSSFKARLDATDVNSVKYYSNGTNDPQLATATVPAAIDAAATVKGAVVELLDKAPYDGDVDTVLVVDKDVAKLGVNPVSTVTTGSVTNVTVTGTSVASKNAAFVTGYEGLAKGDVVLYYSLVDEASGLTHYFIEKCDSFTGTVTGYNATSSTVTIDSKSYSASALTGKDFVAGTTLFGVPGVTFYVDNGGYIVTAVTAAPVTTLNDYVFVRNAAAVSGVVTRYDAALTFMDGTTAIGTIAKTATTAGTLTAVNDAVFTDALDNDGELKDFTFYTYTKNADGTYNLKLAANQSSAPSVAGAGNEWTTIKAADFLDTHGTALATANTKFVLQNVTLNTFAAYTGVTNAPLYTIDHDTTGAIYVLSDPSNTAYALAAVGIGGVADTTVTGALQQVFITGAGTEVYNATANYYTYPAVVNGEITTIESLISNMTVGNLYLVTSYVGEKINTAVTTGGGATYTDLAKDSTAVSAIAYNAGTLTVDAAVDAAYLTADTCKVFVYNTTLAVPTVSEITLDQIAGLTVSGNEKVTAVQTSGLNANIAYVYITIA